MQTKLLTLFFFSLLTVSCAVEVIPEETSPSTPHYEIITKKTQKVIRYNCNHEVISDRVETVNHLTKSYSIEAEEGQLNLYGFMARNPLNGQGNGSLSNYAGKFSIDVSPTLLHIQVYPGLNEILYQFSYCDEVIIDQQTNRRSCAHPLRFSDEKSFWLEVDYRKKFIPEIKHIYSDPESCKEQSK